MDAMERLRRRLNLMIDERTDAGKIRHNALARFMGKSEVWLSNVLSGKRGIRIKDLDKLADFFRIPVSELVRESDAELIEVTPSELALLRKLRRAPDAFKDSILTIAGLQHDSPKPPRVVPKRTRRDSNKEVS